MRVQRLNHTQNARSNMALSQLKANGIVDQLIVKVMELVPRENFVPLMSLAMAYGDGPIFCDTPGRYIFPPQTIGLFLQNLSLYKNDKVLVVGGNYGYSATILLELGCEVFVVESQPILVAKCREKLKKHHITIESGDLHLGLSEHKPYKAIIIEAGISKVPASFADQLENGGRLAVCINDNNISKGCVFEKNSQKLNQVFTFEANMPTCHEFDEPINFKF